MVPSSRENLNRKALFLPSNIGFACFFLKPIQWYCSVMSNESQYLGHNMEPGKNPSPIQCHRKSLCRNAVLLHPCIIIEEPPSLSWVEMFKQPQHHLDLSSVCVRASGTSKNWMIYIESLQLTYGGFHESTGVTPQLSSICLWIVHVFHHPLIGVPPNINIYGSMALHSLPGHCRNAWCALARWSCAKRFLSALSKVS